MSPNRLTETPADVNEFKTGSINTKIVPKLRAAYVLRVEKNIKTTITQ
jgi:hypothetical protein